MNMQTLFQEYRKRKDMSDFHGFLIIAFSLLIFYIISLPVVHLFNNKLKTIESDYSQSIGVLEKSHEYQNLNDIYIKLKESRNNDLSFGNLVKTEQAFELAINSNNELLQKYNELSLKKDELTKIYLIKIVSAGLLSLTSYLLIGLGCVYFARLLTERYLKPKRNIKRKILEQKHNGSIYEIFDKNCEATSIVLKEYVQVLEYELLNKQFVSGETLIKIDNAITKEKAKQAENRELKERKEALIVSDTQSGTMLREIESLKNNN
jgi:hypothetical protein